MRYKMIKTLIGVIGLSLERTAHVLVRRWGDSSVWTFTPGPQKRTGEAAASRTVVIAMETFGFHVIHCEKLGLN